MCERVTLETIISSVNTLEKSERESIIRQLVTFVAYVAHMSPGGYDLDRFDCTVCEATIGQADSLLYLLEKCV